MVGTQQEGMKENMYGHVRFDDNQTGVANHCIQCYLKHHKHTVAHFIWEGQSLCEEHVQSMKSSFEDK